MDKYSYVRELGVGEYSSVWLCQDKATCKLVAIKRFKDSCPAVARMARREVRMLRLAQHRNIIHLLEAFKSKSGRAYLVMEYVDRTLTTDLWNYPHGLPLMQVKLFMWQLCQAVRYLHHIKVLHCDLKPADILVSSTGIIKLCDFGIARTLRSAREHHLDAGTATTTWYQAPEALIHDKCGTPVDVWALGCIFAELVTGRTLLPGVTCTHQLELTVGLVGPLSADQMRLAQADVRLQGLQVPATAVLTLQERFPDLSPDMLQLLCGCLQPDPALRSTAEQLLALPYFDDIWDMLPQLAAMNPAQYSPGLDCYVPSACARRAAGATPAAAIDASATSVAAPPQPTAHAPHRSRLKRMRSSFSEADAPLQSTRHPSLLPAQLRKTHTYPKAVFDSALEAYGDGFVTFEVAAVGEAPCAGAGADAVAGGAVVDTAALKGSSSLSSGSTWSMASAVTTHSMCMLESVAESPCEGSSHGKQRRMARAANIISSVEAATDPDAFGDDSDEARGYFDVPTRNSSSRMHGVQFAALGDDFTTTAAAIAAAAAAAGGDSSGEEFLRVCASYVHRTAPPPAPPPPRSLTVAAIFSDQPRKVNTQPLPPPLVDEAASDATAGPPAALLPSLQPIVSGRAEARLRAEVVADLQTKGLIFLENVAAALEAEQETLSCTQQGDSTQAGAWMGAVLTAGAGLHMRALRRNHTWTSQLASRGTSSPQAAAAPWAAPSTCSPASQVAACHSGFLSLWELPRSDSLEHAEGSDALLALYPDSLYASRPSLTAANASSAAGFASSASFWKAHSANTTATPRTPPPSFENPDEAAEAATAAVAEAAAASNTDAAARVRRAAVANTVASLQGISSSSSSSSTAAAEAEGLEGASSSPRRMVARGCNEFDDDLVQDPTPSDAQSRSSLEVTRTPRTHSVLGDAHRAGLVVEGGDGLGGGVDRSGGGSGSRERDTFRRVAKALRTRLERLVRLPAYLSCAGPPRVGGVSERC